MKCPMFTKVYWLIEEGLKLYPVAHLNYNTTTTTTRMYSSRMRTTRALTDRISWCLGGHACPCNAPPCHACPLPPPTTHAPSPHHACPPPVDRILDTCFWKYYLAPTSLWAITTTLRTVCSRGMWYLMSRPCYSSTFWWMGPVSTGWGDMIANVSTLPPLHRLMNETTIDWTGN